MYTKDVKTKMTLREITNDALSEILKKHLAWINDEPGGEQANLSSANLSSADLRYADLSSANLSSANLRYADLIYADLSSADLRSADLDYSAFPLWCGSFGAKVDIRLSAQLAYHFCRLDTENKDVKKAQKALKILANKFHRVKECGEIE